MRYVPVKLMYLLTLIAIPLTGCKQRPDGMAAEATRAVSETLSDGKNSPAEAGGNADKENLTKRSEPRPVLPTEIDQVHVESAVLGQRSISPEKKGVLDAMAKVDAELNSVEFRLQGALFEVRQTDEECRKNTRLLASSRHELNEALESHPERVRLRNELSRLEADISGASGHIESLVAESKAIKSRRQTTIPTEACRACGWNGSGNHLHDASVKLAKLRQDHGEALRIWSKSKDELSRTDEKMADLARICEEAQNALNARFATHPATAGLVAEQRSLRDEKKRLQDAWTRLIMSVAPSREVLDVGGTKPPSGS